MMTKLRPLAASITDLWRSSALIQGALALMFGATIVYLAIAGKPIPEVLVGALMAIIGFYFGTKQRTP